MIAIANIEMKSNRRRHAEGRVRDHEGQNSPEACERHLRHDDERIDD